ncbi:MAG: MFS transporter [Bacteroidales bacterium]|nr:MFS transporter [Bacteroidales bacterium]
MRIHRAVFSFLAEQKAKIAAFPFETRKFITSNFFFGLFNPFYIIFSNTFIFQATKGDLSENILYCIFTYLGILAGFFISGLVASRISFRNLLIGGVWLMFLTIFQLFSINPHRVNSLIIILAGFFTGVGSGVYWSARNYLSLELTNDNNRDFFSGIDYILISAGRILTPLIIGIYIGLGIKHHWFSASFAYRSVLTVALILAVLVTLFTLRVPDYIYRAHGSLTVKTNALWTAVRKMFFYLGFYQSAFFVVPTVFIMKFIGGENMVGTLNALCYLLAILTIYYLSSRLSIHHRTRIMRAGFYIFLIGTILFSTFLPFAAALGTYLLIFLMFFTESILNYPARATMLKATEEIKSSVQADGYQYLTDVELFAELGRLSGLVIFYVFYHLAPYYISLPAYIVFTAVIQWQTVKMSKIINGT